MTCDSVLQIMARDNDHNLFRTIYLFKLQASSPCPAPCPNLKIYLIRWCVNIMSFSPVSDANYQLVCTDCGGTVIEYDQAAGNGICVKCGTVIEENTIVNEIAFGETSSGAAMVQGSFVAQGASAFLFIIENYVLMTP